MLIKLRSGITCGFQLLCHSCPSALCPLPLRSRSSNETLTRRCFVLLVIFAVHMLSELTGAYVILLGCPGAWQTIDLPEIGVAELNGCLLCTFSGPSSLKMPELR